MAGEATDFRRVMYSQGLLKVKKLLLKKLKREFFNSS